MSNIVTIFLTLIIFAGVIGVIYILTYNNLQACKIKINEAESVIDELLRNKHDLLLAIKADILTHTDIDDKAFEELESLKDINISSFDFERKLTSLNNLIEQIKLDYDKLEEDESFNNIYEDIFKLNERLEATKAFYNKYTSCLNKLIKKFPSNLIAKIHHVDLQTYFDGKDLFDENKEDFKI